MSLASLIRQESSPLWLAKSSTDAGTSSGLKTISKGTRRGAYSPQIRLGRNNNIMIRVAAPCVTTRTHCIHGRTIASIQNGAPPETLMEAIRAQQNFSQVGRMSNPR